jgi:hypothetical protein
VEQRPAGTIADDKPRFDVVAHGERGKLSRGQEPAEARHRATGEERVFLPKAAKERRRAAGIEYRARTILRWSGHSAIKAARSVTMAAKPAVRLRGCRPAIGDAPSIRATEC